jgi:CHAT domain-containing protein
LNELYRSDFTAGEQDSLHTMINDLETKLRQAINYKLPERNTFKSLKAKLRPNEAMVDVSWYYHFYSDTSGITKYAGLITKSNSTYPEYVLLSTDKKDDQVTIRDYNDRMDKEQLDTLSYDLFFKKILSNLNGISKIYISTKGDYSRINFQTLFNPATRKYVIDEMDIVYMPDLGALQTQEINTNTTQVAQLFGNPDFNYDFRKKIHAIKKQEPQLLAKRFGLTTINDLPGTETELNGIEKLLTENAWKFSSFTREKASEENLRKVNSPKLLHIATHGYFLKEVDTDDDKFLGYNSNAFKQLADVRSGLILAGAAINTNDTVKVSADKDGLLTSREASLLNLSNTDVVILSACQTGLGVETLNMGVIGLQQAFSNAGAKNLILSLWPVDDNATQLLMVKFYEYWLKDATNQNISAAFKKAQVDVKQKYPHPYYWGAFVLLEN